MNREFIEPELLNEIPAFEEFLKRMGLKRIEGAVYGLLTLSSRPLSSEEIEQTLNLSQSAVSMALKTLTYYGAVETMREREKKGQVHQAKEDSISIVATVFKKREQEAIEEFKNMAQRSQNLIKNKDDQRYRRLSSIVTTCEMAEVVMNFVIKVASKNITDQHRDIVAKLPKMLDAILFSEKLEAGGQMALDITTQLASKFLKDRFKLKGENSDA
jgi:DNA-binding transcriptional regulator GbsR (MarR family)